MKSNHLLQSQVYIKGPHGVVFLPESFQKKKKNQPDELRNITSFPNFCLKDFLEEDFI